MSKIEGLYARVYDLVVISRIVPSGMDIKTSEGVELLSVCVCVCVYVCVSGLSSGGCNWMQFPHYKSGCTH
jgi:hypothetical protein